jgi:hypothetical protein
VKFVAHSLCTSMHENGGMRKKLGTPSYISWLHLVLQHLHNHLAPGILHWECVGLCVEYGLWHMD